MRLFEIKLAAGAIAAAAFSLTMASAPPAAAAVSWTPIKFRTISGIRPFVETRLNGKPFLLMVHANASFYAMTNHANAASVGLTDLKSNRPYGISSDGHVSELGSADATLRSLQVGDDAVTDVPIKVFETPESTMQGMLGIKWLKARQVIVDFTGARIGTPRTPQDTEAEDKRLLAEGYVAHPMTWNAETDAYTVEGAVDGVATRIAVATVAESLLDKDFATTSGIALGPAIDVYGGPAGAVGDVLITRREVSFVIDGQPTAPVQPHVFDVTAYDSHTRAANDKARIGSDFMLANQAVIDFGSRTLFLRPR